MSTIAPSTETVVFVLGFGIVYMLTVLRKTLRGKFDLYDFFMLSMVAIVPVGFTLFPGLAARISHATGVAFPFVVMFGSLFLVIFVFMHRMTARLHKLEHQNCALVQELGLLTLTLEETRKRADNA
jgi:hypothetical protein